jgi:hypothetical protein
MSAVADNPQAARTNDERAFKVRRSDMPASQNAVLPDHILAAVLTLAKREILSKHPQETRFAFQSDDSQLQEIFSELQKDHRILDPFVFSDSGPEPYSPALEESVSRLQLSGLIGRENPDYEVVFLQPSADGFFDDVLTTEFDKSQLQQLAEIASAFLKRVRVV